MRAWLESTSHEGREYTTVTSRRSARPRAAGKNCALSRNSVLKTALPDQHGAVKLNTTANIRLAVDFPPRCCPKTTTQTPKRPPPFPGEQDAGLRCGGSERRAFGSEEGRETVSLPIFVQVSTQVLHPTLANCK